MPRRYMVWAWLTRSGCFVMSCLGRSGGQVGYPAAGGVDDGRADCHRYKVADGKAGFTVPVVDLHLGGGVSRERGSEQKVTVVFGGPVDRDGRPVKVASASDVVPG